MKRIAILTIASIALIMALGSASATWLTYREDISVSSATVDISLTYWHNSTTTQTYRNITLPCQLGQLNRTVTKFAIKANGADISYNLTVNGQSIKSSQAVSDGNWNNVTLSNMVSGGVSASDTYLNLTFDVNDSHNIIKIVVYGNDSAVTSSWISSQITVKEKDITSPTVGTSSTNSFWTVNDSIAVTNNMAYTLTDIKLTLSYPSHKVSIPTSQKTISSLASSGSATRYVQYQKYGPYVYKVNDDSSGTSHEVTIYIKSNEQLTNCVDWVIKPSDDVYEGYLDNINTDTLMIKLGNVEKDWELNDDGYIELSDFTVKPTWSQNKFVLTWTEAEITPVAPASWWEQEYASLPMWLWVVIAVIIVAIVGMLLYEKH